MIVPEANSLVNFEVSGDGYVTAVDSGDNTDTDPFQTTKRKAYQGRVFAMIKANKNAGNITIKASGTGLIASNPVMIKVAAR